LADRFARQASIVNVMLAFAGIQGQKLAEHRFLFDLSE